MTEILDTLVEYLWIVDFAALCIFAILAVKNRQIYSSLITLTIIVLMSGIIIQYESFVISIKSPDTSAWVFAIWCIAFVIFDCIVAYILYLKYKLFSAHKNVVARGLFITIATVFIICAAIIQFGPLLANPESPSYKVWVRIAFYLGQTVIYGFVIYAIHQAHVISKVRYTFIARTYLLALLVAAILQIARFLERYTWDTNYLAAIYKWGLVSINITTTAIVLLIAVLAIYQRFSKVTREGVLWNP